MQPLGLSAYRLSTDLGVPPIAVSQILRGRRAISASMALRLGAYFGVEPNFWMSLQAAHDLRTAAQAAATAQGDQTSNHPVSRCPALNGRALVLRETKLNGTRQWEVLLVNTGNSAKAERTTVREPLKAHRAKARAGGTPNGLPKKR